MSDETIRTLLQEERRFPPPEGFVKKANAKDPAIYEKAGKDIEAFWAEQAKGYKWLKPWDKVLDWKLPVREVVRERGRRTSP